MGKTIQQAYDALKFNKDNELYSGDPKYCRVYATFDGGKYDGQITSIKSLIMLEKYLHEGQAFKDINIITDAEGLAELIPKRG